MKLISLARKLHQHQPPVQPNIQCNQNSSTTGNTKQLEQICFIYNEIRPCDSYAYKKGGWEVCEFKSEGERLMDAANTIGETNDLYVAKQRLIIHISGVGHIQFLSQINLERGPRAMGLAWVRSGQTQKVYQAFYQFSEVYVFQFKSQKL